MYIIRPIRKSDLDAYEDLAMAASPGMVNLPKNRKLLEEIIDESLASFQSGIKAPTNETYLFVLEDVETGEIGGTSAIISRAGVKYPLLYFKIEHDHSSQKPVSYLKPEIKKNAGSEICGLFLKQSFRNSGLGKMLSLSRFMFIAAFLYRFQPEVFAEMHGFTTENDQNPFWDAIGRHFFDADYPSLMKLLETDRDKLTKAFPHHPIYISLLSEHDQQMIGKVHPNSLPAMQMLKHEGFNEVNEVDFFDGGPHIKAKTTEIKTIKQSVVAVAEIAETRLENGKNCLISNDCLKFRACMAKVRIESQKRVTLDKNTAKNLLVDPGDHIRYLDLEA